MAVPSPHLQKHVKASELESNPYTASVPSGRFSPEVLAVAVMFALVTPWSLKLTWAVNVFLSKHLHVF